MSSSPTNRASPCRRYRVMPSRWRRAASRRRFRFSKRLRRPNCPKHRRCPRHLLESRAVSLAGRPDRRAAARRSEHAIQGSSLRSPADAAFRSRAIQTRTAYRDLHLDRFAARAAGLHQRSAGSVHGFAELLTRATASHHRQPAPRPPLLPGIPLPLRP